MQRGRALRALALAALCAACAVLPGARALHQPGSLVSVEQVYSSLLVAPVHYPVTGFIALDRFTPLKHAEACCRTQKPFRTQNARCAASWHAPTLPLLTGARRVDCACVGGRLRSR
jgi:hypothetical protein